MNLTLNTHLHINYLHSSSQNLTDLKQEIRNSSTFEISFLQDKVARQLYSYKKENHQICFCITTSGVESLLQREAAQTSCTYRHRLTQTDCIVLASVCIYFIGWKLFKTL